LTVGHARPSLLWAFKKEAIGRNGVNSQAMVRSRKTDIIEPKALLPRQTL